jgi:hypothetical protein
MEYSKSIVGYTSQRQITEKAPLNDFERDLVIYFFAKLKLTDPRFYLQAMPDEKTEKITKREFSESLRTLTKEKIDCGFAELHQLMATNHPDYKFLTIPKVIGVCNGAASEGNPAGAHKYFEPLALPDKTAQEKARKVGACELDRLMNMFTDPEPTPLTPEQILDNERLEKIRDGI